MFKRILVAIDGSAPSDKALATALQIAKEQRAEVRLVSVADTMPPAAIDPTYIDYGEYDKAARTVAGEAIRRAETRARSAGVKAAGTVRETLVHDVSAEIVTEAKRWRADLIVLGTHGRTGIARFFLGSVAEGVARHAPTAVLLVRAAAARAGRAMEKAKTSIGRRARHKRSV
jgi:nucleotide-binding universal stress UspA family protein